MTNIDNQNMNNLNSASSGLKGAIGNFAAGEKGLHYGAGGQIKEGANSFKTELEKVLKGGGTVDNIDAGFNINEILEGLDIGEIQNLDTVNIDKLDAMFFLNVLNQGGITNYVVNNEGNLIDAANYKGIEVSKTLSDLLIKMQESNKAVRLDFDNNVTVVLKLDDGKLNAHFIPGDKAVEEYLKNNIPFLKQRFDEQNIPYANISYRNHRQKGNGQNNKEKKQ